MSTSARWVVRAAAVVGLALALTGCEVRDVPAPASPGSGAASSSGSPSASSASGPATPSASSTPNTTTTTTPAGDVLDRLATLPVKGRAPKTDYDRDLFGRGWKDPDRNGCDARNDILRRDLTDVELKPGTQGCVVLSGELMDPYTGAEVDFVRGQGTSSLVQVDHVVALSDAWQKGAQQLTPERREAFANDPLNLLAVTGSVNASKGDGDAATWLPPDRGSWCGYVARQVQVKARYELWVTTAERDAIERVATQHCPAG